MKRINPTSGNFAGTLIVLLLLLAPFAKAANETTTTRSSGTAILANHTQYVYDTKYLHMQGTPTWPTLYTNTEVSNFITLGVDHASIVYVGTPYRYTFTIEAVRQTWTGGFVAMPVETFSLTVAYDPGVAAPFNDRAIKQLSGGYKIKTRIINIHDDILNTNIIDPADNLYLESMISTNRLYAIDQVTQPPGANLTITTIPASNELEVRWTYIPGAEEYELEWTYLDNYDDPAFGSVPPGNIPVQFYDNSTRISTSQQYYRISNVFEKGYVLFRLRAIGKGGTSFDLRLPARWTWEDTPGATVASFMATNPTNAYQVTTAHELDLKNWQYTATYAGQGKKKEVINYFDGSLRSRQTVTRLNSQQEAIAGETYYDYNGRAAVQVLPVPVQNATIKFYAPGGGLNMNLSNVPYGRRDFDPDVPASCEIVNAGMSTVSGASNYYSSANPVNTGHQAYVPDAELYPFTQTEYTPDNTGRIRRQSGVGPTHQLESGHETKYFYGKPFQAELDRLFAAEAGYASHYQKNMVMDANGQISVSYLDQQGRTIATALAGAPPLDANNNPLFDPLSSSGNSYSMNVDLLNKLSPNAADSPLDDNVASVDGRELVFNQQYLVTTDGIHSFAYNLSGTPFTFTCLGPEVCYDCVYDIEISIKDECGNYPAGFTPVTQTVGNISPFDVTCDNPSVAFTLTPDPLALPLTAGTYTIYKKLKINEDALAFYLDHYLQDPDCVTPLQTFIDNALAAVDTSDCNITCESCVASLGTEADFILNGGTAPEFQALVDQCMAPCQYESSCQASYRMMLFDMSPSGQYADFMDENGNTDPAQFPLSVLNENNSLGGNWRFPASPYLEDDGSPSHIPLTPDIANPGQYIPASNNPQPDGIGGHYSLPQDLTHVADFIQFWQTSWAASLVSMHPEYCYFTWCDGMESIANGTETAGSGGPVIATTNDFDELLMNTLTLAQAQSYGMLLLDPLNVTGSSTQPHDPYFMTGGTGNAVLATAITRFNAAQNSPFNLWDMAYITNNCATMYNATTTDLQNCMTGGTPGTQTLRLTNDAAWESFKFMYLSLKQEIQQQQSTVYAQANGCFNGCIGESSFDPFAYSYVSSAPELTAFASSSSSEPCAGENGAAFSDKIKRFPGPDEIFGNLGGDPATVLGNLTNEAELNYYLMTGTCPGARDLQALLNRLTDNNSLLVNTPMQPYGEFSPLLYHSVEAPGTNSSYVNYTWTPVAAGQTLNVTFVPDAVPACGVSLSFPVSSSFNWSNTGSTSTTYRIEQFYGFAFANQSGSDYYFTVKAIIFNNSSNMIADTVIMDGVTCLPVGNCTFDPICSASWQADKLQHLFNALKVGGNFGNATGVGLTTLPNSLFFQPIEYLLGSTTNWNWKSISSNIYQVFDANAISTSYLQINFAGGVATTTQFSNIAPDPSGAPGAFVVTCFDGSTYTTINGTAFKQPGNVPFPFGSCNSTPLPCQGTEYQNRNDLEAFIQDMIGSPNPVDLPSFTPLLKGQLHPGIGAVFTSTVNNPDADHLTLTFTGTGGNITNTCDLALVFENTSRPPTYTFFNIVSMGQLVPDYANMVNGQIFGFTIVAHYSDGHSEVLRGTSCWPINACTGCSEPTTDIITNFDNYNPASPGFTSDLIYNAACPATNEYTITNTPASVCSALNPPPVASLDHTSPPTGTFMMFRFKQNSAVVYRNAVAVTAGNIYQFETWVNELSSWNSSPEAILELRVNGTTIATRTVTHNPAVWKYFSGTWMSNVTATVNFEIFASNATIIGIDDVKISHTENCNTDQDLPTLPESPYINNCAEHLQEVAIGNATNAYNEYITGVVNTFTQQYIQHCMGTVIEHFTMGYEEREYHYTLYYYDQAGNLVQTVPPAGVVPVDLAGDDDADLITNAQEIINDRTNHTHTYNTQHRLMTTYTFNSLNQIVRQNTPDGGTTLFWYDALGRMRFSQNAQQRPACVSCPPGTEWYYSYTMYDGLGRIVEVGEDKDSYPDPLNPSNMLVFSAGVNDYSFPQDGEEVTKTYYDEKLSTAIAAQFTTGTQQNLRNRISTITIEDTEDNNALTYDHATHYSYDIHGNVKELLQENPEMGQVLASQQFKKVEYDYDLVSGKVNALLYQRGAADQFYHKYDYDADNRVTHAHTSTLQWAGEHVTADYGWEQDAKYFYYAHGPLARTELGDLKVQGIDYAYTLQGWIKGVNSNTLVNTRDIGKDGVTGTNGKWIGDDLYGYALSYFDNDYKAISPTVNVITNNFMAKLSASDLENASGSLYNGNIRHMITAIKQFMPSATSAPQAMAYRYDQLNRITKAARYNNLDVTANAWLGGGGSSTANLEQFAYDANGNITTLQRNGVSSAMDDFKYWYHRSGGGVYDASLPAPLDATNKLAYVYDNPALSGNYTSDIDNQGTNNYTYDRIGNLVSDAQEEIADIAWSVYGKVKNVIRYVGSNKPHLAFKYDAMGHRVAKQVTASNSNETSWYVLDAQGNTLATYELDNDGDYWLREQMVYGSSRVAIRKADKQITATPVIDFVRTLGKKQMEMSNHLGNVLVAVSDARQPVPNGGLTQVVAYKAITLTANDYTAFGAPMDGRSYTGALGSYKYGFNGLEKTNEIYGEANEYTSDFRQYNSRVSRWFSRDPDVQFSESPYVSMANNPIYYIDPLGDRIRAPKHVKQELKRQLGRQGWNALKREYRGKVLVIHESAKNNRTLESYVDDYLNPEGHDHDNSIPKTGTKNTNKTDYWYITPLTDEITFEFDNRKNGLITPISSPTLTKSYPNINIGSRFRRDGSFFKANLYTYINRHSKVESIVLDRVMTRDDDWNPRIQSNYTFDLNGKPMDLGLGSNTMIGGSRSFPTINVKSSDVINATGVWNNYMGAVDACNGFYMRITVTVELRNRKK